MSKRHRNLQTNRNSPGHNQDPGSLLPSQSFRRASLALPGRAPQVGEAELLPDVTQASAEPLTGAILLGPSHIASTPLGFSLDLPEVDDRDSRARGMGHELDGDSHPSSTSNYPLRTNNNNLKSPLISTPSPSGGIPIERRPTLANSGFDPTTNDGYGLSEMEIDERQEGAKETTIPDTSNTHLLNNSDFIDNNVSHSIYSLDKTCKIKTFSIGKLFFTCMILIK